jgi:predicted GNAT family acetyltransferase
MPAEAAAMQRALEAHWERLYAVLDGARFERRGDLLVALYPPVPLPQFNGPWVAEDSPAAADGLEAAVAEVEAAGTRAWVQTRSWQERPRRVAERLGLTHADLVPGLVLRPSELVDPPAGVDVDLAAADEVDATNALLAACFGEPQELFDRLGAAVDRTGAASRYVARADGAVVSTAVGMTLAGATGVFNVATPRQHRGRGYGAAAWRR